MDVIAELPTCRFDNFLLDREGRALYRLDTDGEPTAVPLGSRALGILCLLIDRRGEFVSRREMFETVWPNVVVEDSNLTVQMAALRRALDEGRSHGSCIQTAPGRGYRFVPQVTLHAGPATASVGPHPPVDACFPHPQPGTAEAALAAPPPSLRRRLRLVGAAAALCLLVASLAWFTASRFDATAERPRLSVVVLPFANLSGDRNENYLADAVTDDLTSDLSQRLFDGVVISRASAYTYKGKNTDERTIGRELGVRYVLEGSVRKLGDVLRVNAQLISTESRAQLWGDRFDEPIQDLGGGQEEIVQRLGNSLGWEITQIEAARSTRERRANPDAFDLILRARSLYHQPYSVDRNAEVIALYQQALQLNPTSAMAKLELAGALLDAPDYEYELGHAATLISEAAQSAPGSHGVLDLRADLLRMEGRWPAAMAAAQRMIELYPNDVYGYNHLAFEKLQIGAAAEAIPLFQEAIHLDPRSGYLFNRLRRIGYCLLVLGREQEAIPWLRQSLIANPDAPAFLLALNYREIAAAAALTGHADDAHRALEQANALWPFATVRGEFTQDASSGEAAEAQLGHFQAGLRLAGLRDHADEDADFGVASDGRLRRGPTLAGGIVGYSPTAAPGVTTLRTADLEPLLAERKPVVVDTVANFAGRSIPGAVGLRLSGLGDDFSDPIQDRLRLKMQTLTSGDMSTPIVAVGWNAERLDSRNLALRLVALGYSNVYWYRGGREAWEARRLPETVLVPAEWGLPY